MEHLLFYQISRAMNTIKNTKKTIIMLKSQKPPRINILGGYIAYIDADKHIELSKDYLLENWGARRAALRPYFFLSFILGSLVRYPAFLRTGLKSSSA